jgi:hypothetical protein
MLKNHSEAGKKRNGASVKESVKESVALGSSAVVQAELGGGGKKRAHGPVHELAHNSEPAGMTRCES